MPGARQMLAAVLLGGACAAGWCETVLTLAHGTATDNPRHMAALRFAELVHKNSGGRLQVNVSPNSGLGDDVAVLDKLILGTVDISANSQGPMAQLIPDYAAIGLPYLFESPYQAWRVLGGPVGEELARKSEAKGLVVLAFWDNGFRHITNSRHPIREPSDLRGLKMRTPADAATISFMKALGAEPHTVPFAQLAEALKEGKVDGQENPLINIHTAHLASVQKYLSLTNHKYETTPLLVSKVTWNKLGAAERAALRDAAADATRLQRELMLKTEERMFNRLQAAGMQINSVDDRHFARESRPVRDQWLAGPTGEFTKMLLDAARAAAAAQAR